MKGIGFKLIPIVLIALFILIMISGSFLKRPFFADDDVIFHIDQVKESVNKEEWTLAFNQLKKAQKAWQKIIARIQFSAERDEINQLKLNMERTLGFIDGEDKGGALAELSEAKFIWSELGK